MKIVWLVLLWYIKIGSKITAEVSGRKIWNSPIHNALLQLVVCEVSEADLLALENKPESLDVENAWVVSLSTHMQQTVS